MSGAVDRVIAVAGVLLIGAGIAPQLGDFVTYLVGLGGGGAIVFRFFVDWMLRDDRRPERLSGLSEQERSAVQDRRSWILWIATASGAAFGVALGILALVVDALSR